MWLIKTDTMQLEYVLNSQGFADLNSARRMAGFAKIRRTCELAKEEFGLDYAWVDTCCIDKSSSAELSEAINSMFAWYRDATICITFLSDLPSSKSIELVPPGLEKCRWFRRGWTLQELLAPRRVEFYDQVWHPIGSKKSLERVLEGITGIPSHVLGGDSLDTILVGNRMKWAAMRETTRPEDTAYCLLGIFGINKHHETRGVFASHPLEFRRIPDMVLRDGMHSQEVAITSRLVKFNNIELLRPFQRKPPILPLGLVDKSNSEELGIFVVYTFDGYVRPFAEKLAEVPAIIPYEIPIHDVYLRKQYKVSLPLEVISESQNRLDLNLQPFHLVEIIDAAPSPSFDYAQTAYLVPDAIFVAALRLRVMGIDLVIVFLVNGRAFKFEISAKGYGALSDVDWSGPRTRLQELWARRKFRIDVADYLEHNVDWWIKGNAVVPVNGCNLSMSLKYVFIGGNGTIRRHLSAEFEEYVESGPSS
ncbi:hypothetical protein EKO27_g2757 [Xylaria grammica]|uniref:Heterokaryon incompatibility domain-containing protein n=1 Tax=Xylaria grammica TaxID=363999 RepID=A0A439DD76_9PEZI|nr:hypothetical protein EKO27_g2757 [Xylaria grammica]